MSKRETHNQTIMRLLGKQRSGSVRRLCDADLQNMHDLTMLMFLDVQHTMHARGMHSDVLLVRLSDRQAVETGASANLVECWSPLAELHASPSSRRSAFTRSRTRATSSTR